MELGEKVLKYDDSPRKAEARRRLTQTIDVEPRKLEEQKPLDTVVVPTVNDASQDFESSVNAKACHAATTRATLKANF